jgi:hypothetical protein
MAGTGLDRLSVLPSGLAHQRQNMPRISIAMSGGPNPAEIIDLVVRAQRLGYESAWVAAHSIGFSGDAPILSPYACSGNGLPSPCSSAPTAICMEMRHGPERQSDTQKPDSPGLNGKITTY